ncbi:MAG: hypothetical protein U0838_09995 [Chloroflexota bacterium]
MAATVVLVLAPRHPAPETPRLGATLVVAHGLALGAARHAPRWPRRAPAEVERAVLAGGDMPSLVPGVLRVLLAALDDPALAAATLEAEPTASLPMAVRPLVVGPAAGELLAEGRRALRGVLTRVPSAIVPAAAWRAHDPDGATLRDVDTRRDLFHG